MKPKLNPRAIEKAREALRTYHADSAAFVNRYGPGAADPSPFVTELTAFGRSESVHTIYGQAMTLIEIAADQVTGFLKLISEPYETIAPWTCARAVLDAASLAVWLVEPHLDVTRRVQRSFALRYEGLNHQVKWARAAGGADAGVDPQLAMDRIAQVTNQASALGLAPVLDRNGRQIGIGQTMPSVTELVRDTLAQEDMYRLLSAVAHGHFWATRQAGFEVVGLKGTRADGAHLSPITKAVNVEGMLYLSSGIAVAFGSATWYQSLYAGWKHAELEELLARLFDCLGIRQEHWFWRRGGDAP